MRRYASSGRSTGIIRRNITILCNRGSVAHCQLQQNLCCKASNNFSASQHPVARRFLWNMGSVAAVVFIFSTRCSPFFRFAKRCLLQVFVTVSSLQQRSLLLLQDLIYVVTVEHHCRSLPLFQSHNQYPCSKNNHLHDSSSTAIAMAMDKLNLEPSTFQPRSMPHVCASSAAAPSVQQ